MILDSGLCVLKLLIVMFDRGVYGSELVKKYRYLPTAVYGYIINANFKKK